MLLRCLGKSLYFASIVIWLWAALCALERPAYAYVDPGTGLLFIQIICSTFVGMTFLIRKRIRQFFGRFGRNRNKTAEDVESR